MIHLYVLLITMSIGWTEPPFQKDILTAEAECHLGTIKDNSQNLVHITSGTDYFFYYDSLSVKNESRLEKAAFLVYSTTQSTDVNGNLNPWTEVIAMEIPVTDLRKIKIDQTRIEMTMESGTEYLGENAYQKLGFNIREGADLSQISNAFDRLVEILKQKQDEKDRQ